MDDKLIDRARAFATEAHQRIDQRRKYTSQPYQVHLKAVAGLVASMTDDPEMVAAAWLHDTVEDTPATFGDIEAAFGHGVAALVSDLTDVSRPSDGNRSARKAIDRQHSAEASPRAQTIKVADLIDNCREITEHDPRFARVFLREAAALLEVLGEADHRLRQRACRVLRDCANTLGLPHPLPASLQADADLEEGHALGDTMQAPRLALRLFTEAFTAKSIAEPLRSFDEQRDAAEVAQVLSGAALDVAGVRRDGRVHGFIRAEMLPVAKVDANDTFAGTCGEFARAMAKDQVLAADDRLSDVVEVLTRHDFGFVHMLVDFTAVVGVDARTPAPRSSRIAVDPGGDRLPRREATACAPSGSR